MEGEGEKGVGNSFGDGGMGGARGRGSGEPDLGESSEEEDEGVGLDVAEGVEEALAAVEEEGVGEDAG